MSFSLFANLLWAAGFVGNAGLLTILVLKKRWRQFPVFAVLSGFELFQTATLFSLSRFASESSYYWGFYSLGVIDVILQILLLVEIASSTLRPKGKWLIGPRPSLLVPVAIGVALATILSMAASPPLTDKWDLWEMRSSLFTSLLSCELCAALTRYSNRLGLQWKTHALGIIQGYAAWAVTSLVGDALYAASGWQRTSTVFDQLRMTVYIGVLLYWILIMSRAEQRRLTSDVALVASMPDIYSRRREKR